MAVGSAIELYDIAPGMAFWPMGKTGGGWLLLPTELDATMDSDVWPLAAALLAIALHMGELFAVVALAVALMAMGA
jgi:hypothetical protein